MRIVITKRGQNSIASNREYLESNFYPEYGRWFEDKVVQTIRRLSDNPEMGREAFPEIERPEIRKILCDHYSYWIYYGKVQYVVEHPGKAFLRGGDRGRNERRIG